MEAPRDINRLDLRLYPLLVAPGSIAFWLLGVALTGNGWGYGLMAMLGWCVASVVWWQLYRRLVLARVPAARGRFYAWCVLAQAVLVAAVAGITLACAGR